MTKQLRLLDTRPDWRLDERTRRIGLDGVAKARAALRRDDQADDRTERPAA